MAYFRNHSREEERERAFDGIRDEKNEVAITGQYKYLFTSKSARRK